MTIPPSQNQNPRDRNEKSQKSKFADTFSNFRKNEKVDDFYQFAQNNPWHTAAAIGAIIGLIIYFFAPFLGGLILGVIGGLYFSDNLIYIIKNFESFLNSAGAVKIIILTTIFIALIIAAPAIFLGLAIATVVKYIIANK